MTDFYLTSTFKHPWNVTFNPKIGAALEKAGLTGFLAHRDTSQVGTSEERYMSDIRGIQGAKCILAIALNESPNWGAEVGYMHGLGKPVVALTTLEHEIPLICAGMIAEILRVENLDAIETYSDELVALIRKHL